jgi:hypothetical protein
LEALVAELSSELMPAAQPTPQDPLANAGDHPIIIETPTGIGDRYRVTVIWDKWGGLPIEDRNRIIMEAYRRSIGSDTVNISLTLGLTKAQHQQMSSGMPLWG